MQECGPVCGMLLTLGALLGECVIVRSDGCELLSIPLRAIQIYFPTLYPNQHLPSTDTAPKPSYPRTTVNSPAAAPPELPLLSSTSAAMKPNVVADQHQGLQAWVNNFGPRRTPRSTRGRVRAPLRPAPEDTATNAELAAALRHQVQRNIYIHCDYESTMCLSHDLLGEDAAWCTIQEHNFGRARACERALLQRCQLQIAWIESRLVLLDMYSENQVRPPNNSAAIALSRSQRDAWPCTQCGLVGHTRTAHRTIVVAQ